jgi:hypothetical protein
MDSYHLYYVPIYRDDQTGKLWEEDPIHLQLAYASYPDALAAAAILRTVYTSVEDGRIEIDARGGLNSYQPGEGP